MQEIRTKIEDLTNQLKELEVEDKIDRDGDEESVFDFMAFLDIQTLKDSIDETYYKILVAAGGYFVMYILVGISLDLIGVFLAEPEEEGEGGECAEGEECPEEGGEEGGDAEGGDDGGRRLFALNQYYLNGPGSIAD